jgi:hypothetical protein
MFCSKIEITAEGAGMYAYRIYKQSPSHHSRILIKSEKGGSCYLRKVETIVGPRQWLPEEDESHPPETIETFVMVSAADANIVVRVKEGRSMVGEALLCLDQLVNAGFTDILLRQRGRVCSGGLSLQLSELPGQHPCRIICLKMRTKQGIFLGRKGHITINAYGAGAADAEGPVPRPTSEVGAYLPAGHYELPFCILLKNDLPSTFVMGEKHMSDFEFDASLLYQIRSNIVLSRTPRGGFLSLFMAPPLFSVSAREYFGVVQPLVSASMMSTSRKTFAVNMEYPVPNVHSDTNVVRVTMQAATDHTAYAPGETIRCSLRMECDQLGVTFTRCSINFRLQMILRLGRTGHGHESFDVGEAVRACPISAGEWKAELTVPLLVPSYYGQLAIDGGADSDCLTWEYEVVAFVKVGDGPIGPHTKHYIRVPVVVSVIGLDVIGSDSRVVPGLDEVIATVGQSPSPTRDSADVTALAVLADNCDVEFTEASLVGAEEVGEVTQLVAETVALESALVATGMNYIAARPVLVAVSTASSSSFDVALAEPAEFVIPVARVARPLDDVWIFAWNRARRPTKFAHWSACAAVSSLLPKVSNYFDYVMATSDGAVEIPGDERDAKSHSYTPLLLVSKSRRVERPVISTAKMVSISKAISDDQQLRTGY